MYNHKLRTCDCVIIIGLYCHTRWRLLVGWFIQNHIEGKCRMEFIEVYTPEVYTPSKSNVKKMAHLQDLLKHWWLVPLDRMSFSKWAHINTFSNILCIVNFHKRSVTDFIKISYHCCGRSWEAWICRGERLIFSLKKRIILFVLYQNRTTILTVL